MSQGKLAGRPRRVHGITGNDTTPMYAKKATDPATSACTVKVVVLSSSITTLLSRPRSLENTATLRPRTFASLFCRHAGFILLNTSSTRREVRVIQTRKVLTLRRLPILALNRIDAQDIHCINLF